MLMYGERHDENAGQSWRPAKIMRSQSTKQQRNRQASSLVMCVLGIDDLVDVLMCRSTIGLLHGNQNDLSIIVAVIAVSG